MEPRTGREASALSAQGRRWQSHAGAASTRGMLFRAFATLAVLAGSAFSGPAFAAPGGELGTLEIGRYACETPDATGHSRGVAQDQADFAIVGASSYSAGGEMGSYLHTGNEVVMTSGPRQGTRLAREARGFLRMLDAQGRQTPVRCVLVNRNNR